MKTAGILKTRHNVVNEPVDLLIFGYTSKLYRDDAKALEFDRESHLIPAPYDSSVLLSRFVSDFSTNYSILYLCMMMLFAGMFIEWIAGSLWTLHEQQIS